MKFQLGQLVATRGASRLPPTLLHDCLTRHARGDWGCVDSEDQQANNDSVSEGSRILSAYPIDPAMAVNLNKQPSLGYGDNTLWIITEADRSVTTFLLPSEY
jgi:hypothetical protein